MKLPDRHLLALALVAAMSAFSAPVPAQDAPAETVEDPDASSAMQDRLAANYAELAGSEEAAAAWVAALRNGDDFEVSTTTMVADTNDADGDGDTTETIATTTTTPIANTAGPMGWGEVNGALAIAGKLVEDGAFASLDSALLGTAETTDADGNVVAGTAGILQMRADGMGWGQIANELGFSLGSVIGNGRDRSQLEADAAARGKANAPRTGRPETTGSNGQRPERAGGPDRAERPERPQRLDRPEKPERPAKPERAERPEKPERPARP
jgi:hypothetical protein